MATASPDKPSSQAVTALILGILGLPTCCWLPAPLAWYLGSQELRSIREGRSSAAGQGFATAGVIMGIIGTVLLVVTFVWAFAFGGMAVLGALMEEMR
ncbi:MAG TPA: DUF4190 domain-containing protein [Thermoanaerobaculia bacterium]